MISYLCNIFCIDLHFYYSISTKVVMLVNAYLLTKSIYACELWLCVLCCMCAKLICMCAKLICMCDDFVPAVVDKNSLCQNYFYWRFMLRTSGIDTICNGGSCCKP